MRPDRPGRRRRSAGRWRPARRPRCSLPTSYTFWSQSIIAEVYALHIAVRRADAAARCCGGPSGRPSAGSRRFFAAYAIGFGNHLSMILLAPAFALFLLAAAPNGWRSLITPRVLALASGCACAGALQYAWNLRRSGCCPIRPTGSSTALQRFWFDVTKADWRETMVMQVPRAMARRPRGDVRLRSAPAVRVGRRRSRARRACRSS